MYEYYTPVISDEHMLFAREIAEKFNIRSMSDNPHTSLIRAIIFDFIEKKVEGYRNLYYNTSKGLVEVFPQVIYLRAIKVLEDQSGKYTSLDGKTYNYKVA